MKTPETPPLPTLPLHLMLTMGCWLSSPFAWRCAKSAFPPSSSNPKSPLESQKLEQALANEVKNRASEFLSGLLRYVDAPYRRDVREAACIWRRGNARLLDYGQIRGERGNRGEDPPRPTRATSTTVLFIPSLINRYYILDLEEERSLLRFLATQGIYPLVLDWDAPGEFERGFNCDAYITEILNPAIDFVAGAAGGPIALAGYCMGGNLALAAARLKQTQVGALALLATPWDFHCKAFSPFVVDKRWLPMIEGLIAAQKHLPADVIQSLFYMTDPWVFEQKFRRFAGLQGDSRAARDFVALESWVNDGVPMTAAAAQECLVGWAQQNRLARGQWQVAGKAIDPGALEMPVFIAMPQQDHVVPRDCAQPLADALPQATVVTPGAGHVGMIVGSHAKKELWQPLAQWLKKPR